MNWNNYVMLIGALCDYFKRMDVCRRRTRKGVVRGVLFKPLIKTGYNKLGTRWRDHGAGVGGVGGAQVNTLSVSRVSLIIIITRVREELLQGHSGVPCWRHVHIPPCHGQDRISGHFVNEFYDGNFYFPEHALRPVVKFIIMTLENRMEIFIASRVGLFREVRSNSWNFCLKLHLMVFSSEDKKHISALFVDVISRGSRKSLSQKNILYILWCNYVICRLRFILISQLHYILFPS